MSGSDIDWTKEYPLLPLRDTVIFPGSLSPLYIGRTMSARALDKAFAGDKLIILSAQKESSINAPSADQIYDVGSLARISQVGRLPDGSVKALVEGLSRARIVEYGTEKDFLLARAQALLTDLGGDPTGIEALRRSAQAQFDKLLRLSEAVPEEIWGMLSDEKDAEKFCDIVTANTALSAVEKQQILQEPALAVRFEKLMGYLQREIEVAQIEKNVRARVKKQMEKTQRDYYLNEQMKAIQKELGASVSEEKSEFEETRAKMKKAKMPAEVEKRALKELARLEKMAPMSAEGTVARNYIDWLIDVPWSKKTKDKINLKEAQKILDEDHYGLEKVKERIIEYLAVRKLVKRMKGPILCFFGPPGVGKTSLGRSIARAMGREFARFSLGGVRDEAEIRGHRRTYVGALPGRIIQAMKRAKVKNPLIMLDEIDKVGIDFRGDPSSALLEALDPEQNMAFNDHYLEVDYDLSEVMFITTANTLHTIPSPLRDRMEALEISGYSDDEKMEIARRFLLPKQKREHGLENQPVELTDQALLRLIRNFTRESGARELERQLGSICRKLARETVSATAERAARGKRQKSTKAARAGASRAAPNRPVKIDDALITRYLGEDKYLSDDLEPSDRIGVATGLAWSAMGGSILKVEAIPVEGKGGFILTGKLGEVMKESAQAALTYIRSRRREFGLTKGFHEKIDIHLHIPEGAIPKEGPSAGVTLTVALVSALTKRAALKDVAMTGEINLRGGILPIGGLKEKMLAAKRAGVKKVLIPRKNSRDLSELPAKLRSGIEIELVSNLDEVIDLALSPTESTPRRSARSRKISARSTRPIKSAVGSRGQIALN